MSTLASAVCELMGWVDGESLRARLARVVQPSELPQGRVLEPAFVREVAERCAVNETYFFRHAEQLAASCEALRCAFPGSPLVVWSAACSTGEESYSLAMQLLDGGVPPEHLEVLGSDVSRSALVRARLARYGEWSFRGVPLPVRERCFSTRPGPDSFEVKERYRRPVRFVEHNLLSPPPLRRAHLIACRNALIYLQPDAVQQALRHLASVLLPGGFLILGTAEQHLAKALQFEAVVRGGLVLLRKPACEPVTKRVPGLLAAPHPEAPEGPVLNLAAPGGEPDVCETAALDEAWRALRCGATEDARLLASHAAAARDPEAHLVLAALDDAAGDSQKALEHLRRALYLDPKLIVAHVAQASLYHRVGRHKDAVRARSNALRHLAGLSPETLLRALIPVTARELRDALEAA